MLEIARNPVPEVCQIRSPQQTLQCACGRVILLFLQNKWTEQKGICSVHFGRSYDLSMTQWTSVGSDRMKFCWKANTCKVLNSFYGPWAKYKIIPLKFMDILSVLFSLLLRQRIQIDRFAFTFTPTMPFPHFRMRPFLLSLYPKGVRVITGSDRIGGNYRIGP